MRTVLGLALAGLVAGPAALAKDYDPYQPRVEEVLDADGSVWQVQIVPQSRRVPVVHTVGKAMMPPAPAEAAPETYEAAPEAEKADKPKTDEPEAKKDEPAEAAEPRTVIAPPFGVEIVPRYTYPAPPGAVLPPEAVLPPVNDCARHVDPLDYAWVYRSIPFYRHEYISNPSYRHEATMEVLFGKLRPTVVHKHPGEPRPHETLWPFENNIIRPYSYYSLGPGGGYGRGPLPFAYPGAYGVNYNFYWPMPTVYRAY